MFENVYHANAAAGRDQHAIAKPVHSIISAPVNELRIYGVSLGSTRNDLP